MSCGNEQYCGRNCQGRFGTFCHRALRSFAAQSSSRLLRCLVRSRVLKRELLHCYLERAGLILRGGAGQRTRTADTDRRFNREYSPRNTLRRALRPWGRKATQREGIL